MSEAQPQKPKYTLSGIEKASVLMIALGMETSASVLQLLTPDEIERLTAEIVHVKRVDPDLRTQVMEDGRKSLNELGLGGGADYARKVLEQVVGGVKARELIARLTSSGVGGFRWLRSIPPQQLAQSIKDERPQVVSLVLGHLPPELAAQVVSSLPEQLQGEVALRLTSMQPTDPEIVRSVDEILIQRLSTRDGEAYTKVGGHEAVVEILNNVDRGTEKKILEYLTEVDEPTANAIKEMMFVFEDILALDNRSIQAILREVPQDDLRLALKGAADNVQEVFLRNMSQRAAEALKDDLEGSGPVKLRDVEAAQGRIANIARQLDESGEISLRDGGDDVVV